MSQITWLVSLKYCIHYPATAKSHKRFCRRLSAHIWFDHSAEFGSVSFWQRVPTDMLQGVWMCVLCNLRGLCVHETAPDSSTSENCSVCVCVCVSLRCLNSPVFSLLILAAAACQAWANDDESKKLTWMPFRISAECDAESIVTPWLQGIKFKTPV